MAAVLKNHERYWGKVAIYGDYKPYFLHKDQGGDSTNYPAHSGRILDLKDGKAEGIRHFADMIAPELADGVVIVTVPSHDPGATGDGLQKLAEKLAERTFLHNHADGVASMDLFVVPTISFRLLYGLLILQHGRRQILWLGVTAHPTAEWIARQLTEAYGWVAAPRDLVRDRDAVYGEIFIRRLQAMGIRDRPTAARSPWQNGYAERLIGSIRRDSLDHVVVFGERHLRHLLESYQRYYNEARTHLSLSKDAPVSRAV